MTKPLRRAVFLDRDGVLNRALVVDGKPYPPANLASVELLPGAAEACQTLSAAGFLLICVTNQPDVARGKQSRGDVEAINAHISKSLKLDDLRTCWHDDADKCACRKPKPGLLIDAARDHDIDLAASIMVGDRWRDIEAGQNAGCKTVLIDHGYNEHRPEHVDVTAQSLIEAVPTIVNW